MKKMLFILNPRSGRCLGRRYLPELISIFNQGGYEVAAYITDRPGSCTQIVAQRAQGCDLVVCCGGDGTLNETVSGLMTAGLDTPLGYLPAGSTNDFAATLRLPKDLRQAARHILKGQPRRYDLGRFGDRYFAYVASFGAFTRTSYATPQNVKNLLGHSAYLLEGIQELPQIRPSHLRLELDGGRVIEGNFIFGAICNSTRVGGILTLDPEQVDLQDGLFEVLLVRAPGDWTELAECIRSLKNQTYNCAMVDFLSAGRLRICADPAMDWTLDGEREPGHETVTVENLRRAIQIH